VRLLAKLIEQARGGLPARRTTGTGVAAARLRAAGLISYDALPGGRTHAFAEVTAEAKYCLYLGDESS
jgi:hypothetical protein